MGVKEDIDAKNAKIKADNERGKAGIQGQLQDRIANIEKYLGWRKEDE
jgi:hypothetical protein